MKLALTLVLALLTVMTLYDAGHAHMYSTNGGMDAHGSAVAPSIEDHEGEQTALTSDCESILIHCAAALDALAMSMENQTLAGALQFGPAGNDLSRGRSLASDPPPPRA